MIEDRPLNRVELLEIINDAPESETKNLKSYLDKYKLDAYNFLNNNSKYRYGLVIKRKPVYFAYVAERPEGGYELWTVVNSNVKEQKSLYKHSKMNLMKALQQFSPIYATMETGNEKNIRWVERMGFKKVFGTGNVITLRITKE